MENQFGNENSYHLSAHKELFMNSETNLEFGLPNNGRFPAAKIKCLQLFITRKNETTSAVEALVTT